MSKISVLMSVYNDERHVGKAIKSILTQNFSDFEFIIIDDNSSDKSCQIIEKMANADSRIKFHKNKERLGLGSNLKRGVEIAESAIIARMDSDDISLPERLQIQYTFLKNNPSCDIVGSWAVEIDEMENIVGHRKAPEKHEDIIKYIWTCPIIHPTVMFKKESVLKAGSYKPLRRRQDYDLWFRCAHSGLEFANIPQELLKYRFAGEYFKKNNLPALFDQAKIGWKGCWLIKASPIAYIGVAVPIIKGILPKMLKRPVTRILKKFDPRNTK